MVFSSVPFLLYFLPLFLLGYALLPNRNATALLFSAVFYFWGEGWFISVLALSIVLNYIVSLRLDRARSHSSRKYALGLGVGANLALLFYFKYFGFFLTKVLGWSSVGQEDAPHLLLGISFFTFQSISYLVDVYRGQAVIARSIWDLALYVTMFPQLIAGPIVRYASVDRQIHRRTVRLAHVRQGLLFFSTGLAQKVLIANNVASVADGVFALPTESLSFTLAWAGTLAYTLQIFFDFSGYSNMAIGLGFFMGFRFPLNFNYPYIAQSITEFWRRWHISLSTWFRDYVYIPLGGNRGGTARTLRNLFTVFLLCGLWHGASWTFVAWGIYHGTLLVVERLGWASRLASAPRPIRHLYTMLGISVGWVLFRADTFEHARLFLGHMFLVLPQSPNSPYLVEFGGHQQAISGALGIIASTPVVRSLLNRVATAPDMDFSGMSAPVPPTRQIVDLVVTTLLVGMSLIYIAADTYNPFIYFRF